MNETELKAYLESSPAKGEVVEKINQGRATLQDALMKLEGSVVSEDVPAVAEAIDRVESFTAKVSLIGQVKAGKTALANALLGVSELLPSDVNPWTSVVTSMHINRTAPKGKKAVFKFFEESDWEDMMSDSGRIVRLAKKANLDSRLDELTSQIQELKEKTEARLGHNFKMLLGNQHSFSQYNADLIKRYVCLGEEGDLQDREGRFADLTKSADLYFESDRFPYPLSLADTPGVNDPFLVREAATLDNLGQSHICVVVMSAHQALSTVDLGLLRLLKLLRSERIVIFVNRIDELAEPQDKIEEIRKHVRSVLKKQKLKDDIPVIFGSAAWADAAILGHFDNLLEDSVESLRSFVGDLRSSESSKTITDVSGISELRDIISQKVWEQVYQPKFEKEANGARRIAERSLVYLSEANKGKEFQPDLAGIADAVKCIEEGRKTCLTAIQKFNEASKESVKLGMATVYFGFIKKESKALEICLAGSGKVADWVPDTDSLRQELNIVYNTYSDDTVEFLTTANSKMIEAITDAYEMALNTKDGIQVLAQPVEEPPIPLSLMRTMSVDMRASSSIEWLRRKLDSSAYLTQFSDIAQADLQMTLDETCGQNIDAYLNEAKAGINDFFDEHKRTIEALPNINEQDLGQGLNGMKADTGLMSRISVLQTVDKVLRPFEDQKLVPELNKAQAV